MPIHNPTTVAASGQPQLGGPVTLAQGANVTLSQAGQTITIAAASGGPGGGASGVGILNFGAAPGASDTTLVITGQTAIVSGSVVQAWLIDTASADHSVDEHQVEPIMVSAGSIVAGTGFTIYAVAVNYREYGQWNVAWRWS